METLILDADGMTLDDLAAIAWNGVRVMLSSAARDRITRTRALVDQWVAEERTIYGITTGFGALSDVTISREDARQLQENILMSHAAGLASPLIRRRSGPSPPCGSRTWPGAIRASGSKPPRP